MNADILTGAIKGKKRKVHVLKQSGAIKAAVKRGRETNHNQVDGRRWRRDHPARPHEHDMPKGMK